MSKKRVVVFNPDDIKGKLHEAKALAAAYDFSVDTSPYVPKGQMYVCDVNIWRTYDESRRGRRLPGFQLGAQDT